jgi:hypothetical protein
MRKISRTRFRSPGGAPDWLDDTDTPPPGIPGATVTAKPVDFDLSNLLLRSMTPATITGSEKPANQRNYSVSTKDEAEKTVSLSDGTRITFATVN